MPLFKKDPFGHTLFVKRWLIRVFGILTHSRYDGFNQLKIEGSDVIRELPPQNVLFISNHQTYFADVTAMFHVFNASLKGRKDTLDNMGYLWNPNRRGKHRYRPCRWLGDYLPAGHYLAVETYPQGYCTPHQAIQTCGGAHRNRWIPSLV